MDMFPGPQPSALPIPPALLPAGLPDRAARDLPLARLGPLEVRHARTVREMQAAQRLRYAVFMEEGGAASSPFGRAVRRDVDGYDAVCDHLIVVDGEDEIVATCRLLRAERAEAVGGFYAGGEFDLAPLLARQPMRRFVELGRACVARPYRSGRTIELLWAGIWAAIGRQGGDVLMGCASFPGTDPDALALPLAFLGRRAAAGPAWSAAARPERLVPLDRLPAGPLDEREAMRRLPPLIRAYVRLGARFGEGAVIDREFGTTDVLAILPVEEIGPRYRAYFDPAVWAGSGRNAASPSR